MLPKALRIVNGIVVRNKSGVNAVDPVDQLHPLFQPQGKTGGGERIAVNGMFGNNRYRQQIVFTWPAGPGI